MWTCAFVAPYADRCAGTQARKRKADPSSQAALKSKKRSTPAASNTSKDSGVNDSPAKAVRASTSSTKSKSSKAIASSSKPHGKKQEAVYIESDGSDADSDVVVQSPKRVKKPCDLDLVSTSSEVSKGEGIRVYIL